MHLDRFVSQRQEDWQELERLVEGARRRAERLGPTQVLALGRLYRGASADLALARRSFPGDPLVQRLEQLVGRSRALVYDAPTSRRSALAFFSRGYWRLVAQRPLALLVAFLLLFGPAALSGSWAVHDPGAAAGLVPAAFRPATASAQPWSALTPSQQAAFTTSVFVNNIEVTLIAFAGGVTLGLLTAAVLLTNGIVLGAVGGLMVGAGNWRGFLELVAGHGFLELSCILVAGAAGLRLGWAIVAPGYLTRSESARREARASVSIALGTAPWLVAAGIVEGNRARLAAAGVGTDLTVGLAIAGLYWTLVLWRGRPLRDAPAPSHAGTR